MVLETAFVLKSNYGVARSRIVDALADLIQRHNIRVLQVAKPMVLQALDLCRPSSRVSFADALLWAQVQETGAGAIYTFDQRFPDHGIQTLG